MRISIAVYGKYRAALRHIDCAFGANIDLLEYNFLRPLSLALYVRISIAVYGKYRAALRHIDCAFGANIDLLEYPLIHRRRDDGPPLLGGAAPFSSRQRRATFPAIGKVYPTKLGKAERGKVAESLFGFQFSTLNFQFDYYVRNLYSHTVL